MAPRQVLAPQLPNRTRPQHAVTFEAPGVEQFLGPGPQGAPEPRTEGDAEAGLGAIDQRGGT